MVVYPAFAGVASNPFVHIFIVVLVGVDLLTELTKKIIIIIFVAVPAKKTIFACFDPGT